MSEKFHRLSKDIGLCFRDGKPVNLMAAFKQVRDSARS